MAAAVILPSPVASGSIRIGQLLSDPFNPGRDSFINEYDSLPLKTPSVQTGFKKNISHDDSGRLIGTLDIANDTSILVQAEQMSYTALRDALTAFRYTSRRASSQSFLHKMAIRRQPLFFVTAIQKVTNPTFTASNSNITPTTGPFSSLKTEDGRTDSELFLDKTGDDVIIAVEMRKVICRIGSAEEPQHPNDAGYAWKHYKLQGEEDLQLAVGLGRAVEAAEFRALAGISTDSDYTDESADSDDFDFDEDEAGGFCSASIAKSSYRRY